MEKTVILSRRQVTEASNRVAFKGGFTARLQAPREVSRFALHFEQCKGEADCWIGRAYLRIDQTCRAIRRTRRPGLPSRRNTEKRQPDRGRGALPEVKDFARGIDDGLRERNSALKRPAPAIPHRYIDPHLRLRHVRVRHSLLPRLSQSDGFCTRASPRRSTARR